MPLFCGTSNFAGIGITNYRNAPKRNSIGLN